MAYNKLARRAKIKKRVRKHVLGTSDQPRLSVFRSNKEIYAQIIDDQKGITLVSSSSLTLKDRGSKTEMALKTGKDVAEKATKAGIDKVRFDRNGYLYHGRIKSLAEGAREGGLKF